MIDFIGCSKDLSKYNNYAEHRNIQAVIMLI